MYSCVTWGSLYIPYKTFDEIIENKQNMSRLVYNNIKVVMITCICEHKVLH